MIAIPGQEKFDGMFFKQNWNILQKRISMVQNYGPLRQKYFTAKKRVRNIKVLTPMRLVHCRHTIITVSVLLPIGWLSFMTMSQ